MPLPPDLPIVDHHCHLAPTGEGVEAARRFHSAGGTHLFLCTQQYGPAVATTVDAYREQFETTEALARRIASEVGVTVYVVVAPYPIDLIRSQESLGLSGAVALQRAAIDLAGHWVEEQRAVALGEVGRPHFPVEPPVADAVDEVFRHALGVARDVGCPAVVHCADLDAEGYRELAQVAAQTSFPVHRLIKHYARTIVPAESRGGVTPSFLARRPLVDRVLSEPSPWFLETDFLDDPARPGAVLDLATIPKRAEALVQRQPESIDLLRVPFQAAIEQVYGFSPTLARGN
ncbi:MAG: TatD family hydrolase [Thermoplasmata archaeon]